MNNCYEKLNIKLSPDNLLFEDCKNFEYNQFVNYQVDSSKNNEPDIVYYKSLIETLTLDGFVS